MGNLPQLFGQASTFCYGCGDPGWLSRVKTKHDSPCANSTTGQFHPFDKIPLNITVTFETNVHYQYIYIYIYFVKAISEYT